MPNLALRARGRCRSARDDGGLFVFGLGKSYRSPENAEAMSSAISRSQAIIEFNLDGSIITANKNFLDVVGYTLEEIVGKHHRIFVDPIYAGSPDYALVWERLRRGEFLSQKFRRIAKNGKDVWLQASYNPMLGPDGRPFKVVKFATDITAVETEARELQSKVAAIDRSLGVIEFSLDGTILSANINFLAVVGYSHSEIVGKHHRMFVDPAYGSSHEYARFWERLKRGEFVSEKFRRIAKDGKEIWIQATYNPLMDANNKPYKVIKFAADVTSIEEERRLNDLSRAQKAAEQGQIVTSLGTALRNLSAGNVTYRMNETLAKDYEQLQTDFNAAMESLQATLSAVLDNADSVRSGSTEIASAADDLSRRTEQQAAALEETTAALKEITKTVTTTAQSAKVASQTVMSARSEADRSGLVVQHTISAMREIESSSKKVSQIIGVIDEIAFQTNLLALNAGVEAARAGEAGRGFAVVASEVRALAQRSAEAAKEIKGLISTSSSQVDAGSKLVAETGEALERIAVRVGDISTLVTEMAGGAEKQAEGLLQINEAINQIDQSTQQNASMAEQSTAAVHVLTQQADVMTHLLKRFTVGDRDAVMRRELEQVAPHAFGSTTSQRKSNAGARPKRFDISAGAQHGANMSENEHQKWQEF